MLNVPVNNFSVMLGRSPPPPGYYQYFFFWWGGGGKYVLLKDTTWRPKWGLNPRPLDPESKVVTTRPPHSHIRKCGSKFHFNVESKRTRVAVYETPSQCSNLLNEKLIRSQALIVFCLYIIRWSFTKLCRLKSIIVHSHSVFSIS